MCCEAIPRQVNFLIDEGVLTGKCASSTISCIHYFFEWHGLAETFTQIHVHNCRAQNKNNALIDVVLPLDRSPCFGEWWPGYVELFNGGTCEICTRLVLRTCQAKNKENVYFITIWYSKGSRSRIRREIKIHVYAKRQTWICTTWPSFPPIFRLPFIASTQK